jgi:hypothetical protein
LKNHKFVVSMFYSCSWQIDLIFLVTAIDRSSLNLAMFAICGSRVMSLDWKMENSGFHAVTIVWVSLGQIFWNVYTMFWPQFNRSSLILAILPIMIPEFCPCVLLLEAWSTIWQTLSHNVVCLALIKIRTHNISGDRHWLHR